MRKSAAACVLVVLVVLFPIYTNGLPFLDDAYLANEQRYNGFWAPTLMFRGAWGAYRAFYTFTMGPVFYLQDHFWLIRSLGVMLHIGTSCLILSVMLRIVSPLAASLTFVLFLFFPYSLEAIAWPSNFGQYPFAPFVVTLGAFVALRGSRGNVIIGALLMGLASWVHEQVGPVVLALTGMVLFQLRKEDRTRFAGAVIAVTALNLLVIFATRASNRRLSGPDAGTLQNALDHLGSLGQLIRTTPLGDFYYSTGGVSLSWVSAVIFAAALYCTHQAWRAHEPDGAASRHILFCLVLMAGAYVVCLVPILMSPFPWHTARVVYIPFLAFAVSAGLLAEMILLRLTLLRRGSGAALAVVIIAVILWQAHALAAEARAYDMQIRINHRMARDAAGLVAKADLSAGSLLVVGGFPYTMVNRPLFGEHIIGMTRGELRDAMGIVAFARNDVPRIVFSAGFDRMCKNAEGTVSVRPSAINAEMRKPEAIERVTYLFWNNGKWDVQRHEGVKPYTSVPGELLPYIEACAP